MTPTTIVFACLAIFFFGAWLSARHTVASREKSIAAGTDAIVARNNTIADLERRNFEAGAKIQRLESQLETANEELAGFKAGVKAAVDARTPKPVATSKASTKPAAKPTRKAPAKKAHRK